MELFYRTRLSTSKMKVCYLKAPVPCTDNIDTLFLWVENSSVVHCFYVNTYDLWYHNGIFDKVKSRPYYRIQIQKGREKIVGELRDIEYLLPERKIMTMDGSELEFQQYWNKYGG